MKASQERRSCSSNMSRNSLNLRLDASMAYFMRRWRYIGIIDDCKERFICFDLIRGDLYCKFFL